MKMKIGTELPPDYTLKHEDLAESALTLISQALLPIFAETMTTEMAQANVQGIVTELAYVFDEGEIQIGGKTFRPRLAFVDESGNTLPGVADLNTLHQLTDELFQMEPEADVTFEAPEFDDA
ncbi:hypothetical protein ACJ5NV_04260 [Loktanella agnita]|uniref:hypothetical protein n=1 Tax=Loktanella agnita TaxID=287097 RepID=UPI00398735B7